MTSADAARIGELEQEAVLGAFDAGQLAATVMVGHDGHRGWVYYLAVKRGNRRRGLGRRMMHEAQSWERGAVKLQLMVRDGNAAALGFYQHLGYEDLTSRFSPAGSSTRRSSPRSSRCSPVGRVGNRVDEVRPCRHRSDSTKRSIRRRG